MRVKLSAVMQTEEIGYDDRVNSLQPQNDSETARENWVTG